MSKPKPDPKVVLRRGTDSSGRGIFATNYMWDWWQKQILADKRIKPFAHLVTITQGAWMKLAGGGAADSAGYHDGGGTFDLRVWNLTSAQVALLVKVLREKGAAAYLRNLQHGGFEDAHIHFVLGSDHGLSSGAKYQWAEYLAGRDGLSSGGKDYHPRPAPLVTKPPKLVPVLTSIQKGRRLVWEGIQQLRTADADRKVVRNQTKVIAQALKTMPKK